MKNVSVRINGKLHEVKEGERIIDLCRSSGLKIATLCDHEDIRRAVRESSDKEYSGKSTCRLCMVKSRLKGQKEYSFMPSCSLTASDNLEVITEDAEIANLRKTNLELLFADHAGLCAHCLRNMDCELQNLAIEYDIDEFRFVPRFAEISNTEELEILYEKMSRRVIDRENPAIARDSEKCIKCRRCVKVCRDMQSIESYAMMGHALALTAGTEYNTPLECTYCGQCSSVCPVAAITEKNDAGAFIRAVNDPEKRLIVQTAPAIRVTLGEEFDMPPGTIVTGKMISAIKESGADHVFDTNLAADLTIMEEATELIERIKKKKKPLPLFTSCCPAWVLFLEQHYPEFLPNLSTCRSPHMMMGSLVKNYYAKKEKIKPENIFLVSVMPCTSKKYEAERKEFNHGGIRDVDCVITTRELGRIIKGKKLRLAEMEDAEFDPVLGIGTSAGAIFGSSGGVTEAALRTAYFFLTGENADRLEFKEVRGTAALRVAEIKIGKLKLRTKVVHGLGNARRVMEDLKKGKCDFDFLEVMACPNGCIGGGGQPIPTNPRIRQARARAIYDQDKFMSLRMSHENPIVKHLYEEFLVSPGSRKAEHYLHTKYYPYKYRWRKN